MRLTIEFTGDLNASPSATAGNTTDYLNSDVSDGLDFQARIHVDPPQAIPVRLTYDNPDDIDSGPSSPVDGTTNNGGDVTFAFSTDDLPDNSGVDAEQRFHATVTGLPPAVVHLDFND